MYSMSFEETEQPDQTFDHVLGWLEDSMSLTLSPVLDDSCSLHEFDGWELDDAVHDFIQSYDHAFSSYTNMEVATESPFINLIPPSELHQLDDHQPRKRPARSKRKANKPNEKSSKDDNKEGRWAEQLLNPCALAITAKNSSRVQHYFCVLSELSSPHGDTNRRLAAYGLRALQHHLSSSSSSPVSWPFDTFASSEVKMFQKTLLRFYEVSPWFALPNNMANSAILQILAQDPIESQDLHVLDIGVSHGMQWPTLLEALSCRQEGPPRHVRITSITDATATIPFSKGPPSYNYGSQLIGFAKSLNINLQINVLDEFQLVDTSPSETLIVCVQYRMHSIPLKDFRSLGAKGVIVCESSGERSGDFGEAFSANLEYLWKFLDSTRSGFKEENSQERKLMEGEATKVLMMNEEGGGGRDEKWYERMRKGGFTSEAFGEEAMDGAKSLLRKYDNNWGIVMEDGDTFARLHWKGEAVSFCSLWK